MNDKLSCHYNFHNVTSSRFFYQFCLGYQLELAGNNPKIEIIIYSISSKVLDVQSCGMVMDNSNGIKYICVRHNTLIIYFPLKVQTRESSLSLSIRHRTFTKHHKRTHARIIAAPCFLLSYYIHSTHQLSEQVARAILR